MVVLPIVNSIFNSMSYLIGKDIVVDVGDWSPSYSGLIFVLLTHCHYDHIYGLNTVLRQCPNVKIYTNESGREMLLNERKNLSFYHELPFVISDPSRIVTVKDGEEIAIGEGLTAKAIFTPGHNPSCITWLIDDCLFTGDSYIPGLKTVTNLPGGNRLQASSSIELIKHLANGRTIYPGHRIEVFGMRMATNGQL